MNKQAVVSWALGFVVGWAASWLLGFWLTLIVILIVMGVAFFATRGSESR